MVHAIIFQWCDEKLHSKESLENFRMSYAFFGEIKKQCTTQTPQEKRGKKEKMNLRNEKSYF